MHFILENFNRGRINKKNFLQKAESHNMKICDESFDNLKNYLGGSPFIEQFKSALGKSQIPVEEKIISKVNEEINIIRKELSLE